MPAPRHRAAVRCSLPLLLALGCGAASSEEGAEPRQMRPELADTFLGLHDGALSRCPALPNCRCSQHPEDVDHFVQPFAFEGEADAAWDRLRQTLDDLPRVAVLRDERPYLHARFTTRIWRFEDDVEFLLDADAGVIHVRSASRLGRSDLGANGQRVEALRRRLGG